MSFEQSKLDRSVLQASGIFNKYVYITDDTIADVTTADYFAASRYALIDNDLTNGMGWNGGIIECSCSDGYLIGQISSDGLSLENAIPSGSSYEEDFRYISAGGETQVPINSRVIFSGGPYIFNLLESSEWNKGVNLTSKDATITLTPAGGDTILGQSTHLLTAGEVITLGPDGTNLIIVG